MSHVWSSAHALPHNHSRHACRMTRLLSFATESVRDLVAPHLHLLCAASASTPHYIQHRPSFPASCDYLLDNDGKEGLLCTHRLVALFDNSATSTMFHASSCSVVPLLTLARFLAPPWCLHIITVFIQPASMSMRQSIRPYSPSSRSCLYNSSGIAPQRVCR